MVLLRVVLDVFLEKSASSGLSVIAVFFNMRREAERTLYTLNRSYQGVDRESGYEVMAIDNGSSGPLNSEFVDRFGADFHYHYVDADFPSPCATINRFVAKARSKT